MTMSTPETGQSRERTATSVDARCMSYYLGLRYVPEADRSWSRGVTPHLPESDVVPRPVGTARDVIDALCEQLPAGPDVGLLLSGGIDSAILAALLPAGTPCFTIAFDAPGAVDESRRAAEFAAHWGHPHHIVRCSWSDYETHVDGLMNAKSSPLHAVEVPLHVAAGTARSLGIDRLVVGNGADSTFGGMDKLLAVDWTFDRFVERYRFAVAEDILTDPRDIHHVFTPYRTDTGIDVQAFLREVHGAGIVQAFENAIGTTGAVTAAPYETMSFDGELDLDRIRNGEPKYLLREVFGILYGTEDVPTKIPFARPTDIWFKDWPGPAPRPEFRSDIGETLRFAGGESRWLTWCLDRFLTMLDGGDRG